MVPCPEALVVLLMSISTGRIAFGLALLLAFTLGLAAVLIAIGVAMVKAAPAIRKAAGEARWLKTIPVASAMVISVAGAVLVAQTIRLWRTG
jgi:ABC-type nickel/cobalt efflux system permease component RcnA